MTARARRASFMIVILVSACAPTASAQTSPWDGPRPDSPWHPDRWKQPTPTSPSGPTPPVGASGPAVAALTPGEGFEGTWEIGIEPAGQPRRGVGYFLIPGCGGVGNATVYRADGRSAGAGTQASGQFSHTVFKGSTAAGLTRAWMEQFDVRPSPDGGSAAGTWSNGFETFRTSWRRLVPQGVRLQVVSQTKDTARLEVTGSKLFYLDRGTHASCSTVYVEGPGMTVTARTAHPEAEKLSIDIAVKPGTPAGRRVLFFDGVRLPWDWQGDGIIPRVVELQFGRRERGAFVAYAKDQPMSFEKPFLVRVRYDAEPPVDRAEVTLSWGQGQSRAVPIRKTTADRTVFESGEMFFEDPRTCTGLQFCPQSEGLSHAR